MAMAVNKYVIIMPILNLKQVLHYWVSCQAFDEIGNTAFPVATEQLFVDLL